MDLQTKIILLLAIIAGTAFLAFGFRKILSRLRTLQVLPDWAKELADAFYTPAFWLIIGQGALFVLDVLMPNDPPAQIRKAFFVVVLIWAAMIWKTSTVAYFKKQLASNKTRAADEAMLYALNKFGSAFIFAVGSLFLLDIFQVQLTAILAFGGIGGLAVGWAGKDVVVNFFGGLMVNITRPFAVGEAIRSPNKNFEGIVEDIGWYMTKLRTFARQPMYIPNALFLDAIIENSGRMYNRRILQRISLRYNDIKKVEPVCGKIMEALKSHKEIDQKQMIIAQMVGFGAYSVDIDVICFTKTTSRTAFLEIQHGLLLEIADIVEQVGAEFAFPTNTVQLMSPAPSDFLHHKTSLKQPVL